MSYYINLDLTNRTVSSSFTNLVEATGSVLVNGAGFSFFDLSQSISSSYALTASYSLNGGSSSFIPTVSASWASASIFSTSASFASSSLNSISASWASTSISTSFATTASFTITSSFSVVSFYDISSSYASSSTSSSFLNGPHTGSTFGTASWAVSASWSPVPISASWASASISSSFLNGPHTGSQFGTSSWAVSSSWAPVPISASWASSSISSSYSITSSFTTIANVANNVSQSNLVGTASVYSQEFILTGSYTNYITATSYNLSNSDNGKLIIVNTSSLAIITVPALNQGFACSFFQSGSGQVQLVGSGQTIINNRAGLSSSFGQYSVISLLQVTPGNYVLQGDVG